MKTTHLSASWLLVPVLWVAGCGLTDPPPDPPGSPSDVSAEARSMSSILIQWTAPSTGGDVASYELERAPAVGDFVPVASPDGGALEYTDTGLDSEQRYRYRLRACNDGGCSAFITGAAANTFGVLEITTTSLPDGAIGQQYSESVQAVGAGESYEWSVVAGALPGGLVLDDTSGIIIGIPDTEQTAQFTLQARSIDGQTAQAAYTVDILAALPVEILNVALPPVIVGGTYDVPLRAAGGGATLTWSVVGGTLPAGLSLDPAGRIHGTPAGTDTAAITLRAESAGELDEADFSLVVVVNRSGAFHITPMPVAPIPLTIRPHVDSAIARWERAITGDLQPVLIQPTFFTSQFCGGFGEEVNGTSVDDVIMMINIAPIDGPSNTLGFAGPCGLRGNDIPFVGFLTLDSDDLLPITGTETLTALVFHEMGHILGFGSLWDRLELVAGVGSNQPRFTGTGAKEEYAALDRTGDVPLENDGGGGTAEVHWEEDVFGNEIMTGFSEQVGVFQPLSRVTIASMEDLGYTVNRDEADPYTLSAAARLGLPPDDLGYDLVYTGPILRLSPNPSSPPEVIR